MFFVPPLTPYYRPLCLVNACCILAMKDGVLNTES